MRITKENIIYHELLGLNARVLRHPDPGIEGCEGIIVWETARTLHISSGGRRRVVLKAGGLFELELPDGEKITVEGDLLVGRPYERAKRFRVSR